MSSSQEEKTHVFRRPCGCVTELILNVPRLFGELAKAARYAADHEESYKLMDTQAVREMKWVCDEHRRLKDWPHCAQGHLGIGR